MSTALPPNRRPPSTGARSILRRLGAAPWDLIASWGALVVFTLYGIGLPLVGVGTFLGTQLLAWLPPWQSELADSTVLTNRLIGDTIDSMAPQTLLLVDSVRAGLFPQWNPYVAGGAELAGLPNSGAYSPLSLPWWVLPPTYAPGVVKLLEIAVITLGMSLFLRRLGVRQVAWPLASIVFASSGFLIAWTNWPQTRVAAFIPLLFWALERAVVEARLRDMLPVGVAVAGMMLGGFPAVAGYALYAGAAYVLVRALLMRTGVRAVITSGLVAAGGVLLGLLLSAWQLVPFVVNALSVIDLSIRQQSPNSHLPIEDLASTLVPDINGGPTIGSWGGHPVEHLSYASAVALVLLAAIALFRRSAPTQRGLAVFFVATLLISVGLAYVGGPLLAFAQEFPVFSNNPIGRLRVIVGFSAAVLAAIGFDRIMSPEAPGRELRARWIAGSVGARIATFARLLVPVALGVGAIVLVLHALNRVPVEQLGEVRHQVAAIALTAVLATVAAVLTYFSRAAVLRMIAGAIIPIALVIPAALLAGAWWPKSAISTFYPVSATHEFLDERLGNDRYASVGQAMLPGSSSAYRQRAVGGHAFMTPEWKDLLLVVDEGSLQSATYSTLPPEGIAGYGESPILDRLAVRYLVTDPGLPVPGLVDVEVPAGSIQVDADVSVESASRAGALRGINFTIDEGAASGPDGMRIRVEILDSANGRTLAETTTWVPSISGPRSVALIGEDIPTTTEWVARLSLEGVESSFRLAADGDERLAIDVIRPADDGLRVVATGDATVLERLNAFDRVHWANEAVVAPARDLRLEELGTGRLDPEAVVLESEGPRLDAGSQATIVVGSETDQDRQSFHVEVQGGSGLLVIEDSFRRPGWTAIVDGVQAELIDADHAAAAIALDEGEHDVVLQYTTPGLTVGAWLSFSTLLLVVAGSVVVVFGVRAGNRRRSG